LFGTFRFTLGYFIADTFIYLLYLKNYGALDVGHHFIAIFGYIVGRYYGISTFAMVIFQSNEVSSPLYHIRYFLTQWDLKNTALFKYNQMVFAVLFFVSRVILNSFVLYATLTGLSYMEVPAPAFVKYNQLFNAVAFCLLQYVWFVKILIIGLAKKPKKSSHDE